MVAPLFLLCNFSRPLPFRSLTPHLYRPIKRYSQISKEHGHHEHGHGGTEVKAPSLADEFKRVAEEKARLADQGVASQTAEKAADGAEAATSTHADLEATKEKYKEHEPGADYSRRGN